MTKQEYHDLLIENARNGNFPAIDKEGTCLYRVNKRKDGKRRCSIGLLIPDNQYKSNWEGLNFGTLYLRGYFKPEWIPEGMSMDHLTRIQNVHDLLSDGWGDGTRFLLVVGEILGEF